MIIEHKNIFEHERLLKLCSCSELNNKFFVLRIEQRDRESIDFSIYPAKIFEGDNTPILVPSNEYHIMDDRIPSDWKRSGETYQPREFYGEFWDKLHDADFWAELKLQCIIKELLVFHEIHKKETNAKLCKVCGYQLEIEPWGEDRKTPSYEDCPNCGVTYGWQDVDEKSILKYRKYWVKSNIQSLIKQYKEYNDISNYNSFFSVSNIPLERYIIDLKK